MSTEIDVHIDEKTFHENLAADVLQGLTSSPKYLLPKYFYDTKGSALFDRITELPEYYLTRVEMGLIKSVAHELMNELRPQEVVEIGSGSGEKFHHLLDASKSSTYLRRYLPFDVAETALKNAAFALAESYPLLEILGVVGDFENHLARIPQHLGRRLVVFFGSTIGNLDRQARRDVLIGINRLITPQDRLLLGVDLVKDVATLERAYNDSQGVTIEFNRNILRAINRDLNADFVPEAYQHHAFYNIDESRIEMHLIPESTQRIYIRDIDLELTVSPDESIWTESSHKFTREQTEEMLRDAGLGLVGWYTDSRTRFALALAAPI